MTNPPPTTALDPFSVVVVFATSFGLTGDFASILAAYSVILLSALGGAAWSASGMHEMTRLGTLLHILLMMGLAIVATVPLAEMISRFFGVEIRWLLSPLAIVIAARPDWIIRGVKQWVAKRAGLDLPDDKERQK